MEKFDFDAVIACHAEWKIRLRMMLESGEPALDAADVESDVNCKLGRWLHSDGLRLAGERPYEALVIAHREFHRLAASVVRTAASGRRMEAEAILTGEYVRCSAAVVAAIVELRDRVNREG